MNAHRARPARVAVLLAAHDGMRWLAQQVESILGQQQVDVTLVISVDSSTDGTEQWVEQLARADRRVRMLPPGHFGSAAANFFRLISGLSSDEFDYVALADQDDIWFSDKLSHSVESLAVHSVDAYSGNVLARWPNGRTKLVIKSQPQRKWDFLFEAAGPGCTYLFTKRYFKALQIFIRQNQQELLEIALHDWLCYAFARAKGFTWYIDPQPKMYYCQHDDNHLGVNAGFDAAIKRYRQIRSGWWLGQAECIARLVGVDGHPFVRSWLSPRNRRSYLTLLTRSGQCRRRRLDAIFMAISLMPDALVPASS